MPFYAEAPGVPDVAPVEHLGIPARSQVLQPGIGVAQECSLVRCRERRLRAELGDPLTDRTLQQRPSAALSHDIDEARERPRGDRGAALVVAALQDVAPLSPGDVTQPEQFEAPAGSVMLASEWGRPGDEVVQIRLGSARPLPMVRDAETASLRDTLTAAHPARHRAERRVTQGGQVTLHVELGLQRARQHLRPPSPPVRRSRGLESAHERASLAGHTPARTSSAATSSADRCR
jgi:hypothetical protein